MKQLVLIALVILLMQPCMVSGSCNETEFTCRENDCIGYDKVCDGEMDCIFGNDEINCGGCPQNWYLWRDHLYFVNHELQLNYTEATSFCNQYGATITSILNEEELGFIQYLAPKDQTIWIGINDLDEPGKFVWQDGSEVNFTNWRLNQPNNVPPKEECGEKYADGTWNDNKCFPLSPFICKRPALDLNSNAKKDDFEILLKGHTDRIQASTEVGCGLPLGMQTQAITDDQISSSSFMNDGTKPQFARLMNQSYWTPASDENNPWFQISFEDRMIFSALVLEGIVRHDIGWLWVDRFFVTYSDDLLQWIPYLYAEHNGVCGELTCRNDLLEADNGLTTIFYNEKPCRRLLIFKYQFKAKHVRLHPIVSSKTLEQRRRVGCRLEVLGCLDNDCDYSLGVANGGINDVIMSSSSIMDNAHTPESARLRLISGLGSPGIGWIPDPRDLNPWLQADLRQVYAVQAIVTQGCGDQMTWVEEFCVGFSDQSGLYRDYTDGSSQSACKIFLANKNNEGLQRNQLSQVLEANSMRIYPLKWMRQPCLRVELVGCSAETIRCQVDHRVSCDFTRICEYESGVIESLGYPGPYPQRSLCTWNIITEQGSYILLKFIDFNIVSLGQCDSTSVNVYNGDEENDQLLIDQFCNSRRPPEELWSEYNRVYVVLQSGAEEPGNGFVMEYFQLSRVNSSIYKISEVSDCPGKWTYFRGQCYKVFDNNDPLSWYDAEGRCNDEDGHLVSIRNEIDMNFVHSLIISSLEEHVSPPLNIFIGLKHHGEWIHRWSDGRPMSYTDWHAPRAGQDWDERQPDGGILELCVCIVMQNYHSSDHWYDLPCVSSNVAAQYICMKPSTSRILPSNPMDKLPVKVSCPSQLVKCRNGECRHAIYACADQDCLAQDQCQVTTPPIPYASSILQGDCHHWEYQCKRSEECIAASFLCDFKQHCVDGSDEEDCNYPLCKFDEYACSNGQCVPISARCNLIIDCLTGSDEEMCNENPGGFQCYDGRWLPAHAQCDGQRDCAGKNWEDEGIECNIYQSSHSCTSGKFECKNGACINESLNCLYGEDKYNFPLGCRDASHLQNCDIRCPNGSVRCPDSYCIPIHSRCDGIMDCPNGEDELLCADFQCPGYYKCQGNINCLEPSQLCDGTKQCPDGDDEMFCDVVCPPGCECYGYSISCINTTWTTATANLIPDTVRQLVLVHMSISNSVKDKSDTITIEYGLFLTISDMKFLLSLNVSGNSISHIGRRTFEANANLRILSLAYNNITSIPNATFIELSRLKFLDLSGNPLSVVDDGAFIGLDKLFFLNIQNTRLKLVKNDAFNPMVSLTTLHSDKYLFCCLVSGLETITECLPEADQFSSCADLMRNPTLRAFIWILGISALLGNAYVFYKRVRPAYASKLRAGDITRVQSIIVGNLAVADGIMGIYLLIIASADFIYRDQYAFYAEQWQSSIVCKVAGILSVLSSEASVFFMTTISVDRFFAVLFPLRSFKLDRKSAKVVALFIWILAVILSTIPLMVSKIQDTFYGRSGVCLALPLTSQRPHGWEYSVAVFLGINFIAFVIILVCYGCLFIVIKVSSVKAGVGNQRRSQEYQLALRMSVLVFSDMCCWMPIVVMGLISLTNTAEIPPTSYAWIAVFVLPLNSALNPYLYTISSRQKSSLRNASSKVKSQTQSVYYINKSFAADTDDKSTCDLKQNIDEITKRLYTFNILTKYPTRGVTRNIFKVLTQVKSELCSEDFDTIEKDLQKAIDFLKECHISLSGSITEDRILVATELTDLRAFLLLPDLSVSYDSDTTSYESKMTELQDIISNMKLS